MVLPYLIPKSFNAQSIGIINHFYSCLNLYQSTHTHQESKRKTLTNETPARAVIPIYAPFQRFAFCGPSLLLTFPPLQFLYSTFGCFLKKSSYFVSIASSTLFTVSFGKI